MQRLSHLLLGFLLIQPTLHLIMWLMFLISLPIMCNISHHPVRGGLQIPISNLILAGRGEVYIMYLQIYTICGTLHVRKISLPIRG